MYLFVEYEKEEEILDHREYEQSRVVEQLELSVFIPFDYRVEYYVEEDGKYW